MTTHLRSLAAGVVGTALLVPTAQAGFVINPTYDATISGNAAVKNTIDSAISFYQSTFADDISIDITFNAISTGGILGQSSTSIGVTSYSAWHNALIADSTSTDDAAALAQLTANPFSGNIVGTKANFRALGISVASFSSPDCTIGLNLAACFTGHANPVSGKFDLYSIACHEIDEALGTGSGVGGSTLSAADLYRYDAAGNRSFSTSTAIHTFFSINGTTPIVEYNQFGRSAGDWGDWQVNNPPQVQDWSGTAGVVINGPINEVRLLDVIGYNRAAVPEPATVSVLVLGFAGLIRRRKR